MRLSQLYIFFLLLSGGIIPQNLLAQSFDSAVNHLSLDQLSEEDCFYLDSCLQMHSAELSEQQKINYYSALQDAYEENSHFFLALYCVDTLLNVYQRNNDLPSLAETYRNKSILHDYLGQYPEALSASQAGLEIFNTIGNKAGEASSYNDIGVLHYYVGNQEIARDYFNQSLTLFQQLQDTSGIGMYYNNMANTLFETDELETALEMYQKAYEVDLMMNNKEGQCISLSNIGETYIAMEKYDLAEKKLLEALRIAEDINDPWSISNPLRGLGNLYQQTGELHKAVRVLEKNVKICRKIDALAEQSQNYELLYDLYKKNGDYEKSLNYLELFKSLNDSIFDREKERMMGEMEMKYQLSDKAKEIELITKEKQIAGLEHEQEMKAQKSRQIQLIFGLIGLLIIILIAIRGFLLKKKAHQKLLQQNQIIQQKNEQLQVAYQQIEEKSNEIYDSIRYAKRIQSAILPPKSRVKELLPDAFILYQPKDVVAGDFYWLETVASPSNSPEGGEPATVLFAAADCTGHGVPGAMVSVVCNNGLNRSVREYGLTDPGEILNKTREIVLEEFEKSEEKVNDGMDISLCSLRLRSDCYELKYAGAHCPLWIIRKDASQIEEIKADKQPIGLFDKAAPFTTHEMQLYPGDTIYIFSDGFADQFGGDRGKKMKTGNFKKLLLTIQQMSMHEQKTYLFESFQEWKGDLEQVDDVCVIGVRI
ncbi:MAG: tetratricopeptide repeat protein [Crocinitomicaceae bacterium]